MYRVIHLFKTYFPNSQGGLEEAIRQIGKYSVKHGADVKVVSVSKSPFDGILDGIKCKSYYHNFGSNSMPISFDLIKNFKKEIAGADIIHLQFPWPFAELLTLLFKVKKPVVITFHCDIHGHKYLHRLYIPLVKRLFKKASVIIPTSENIMKNSALLNGFRHKCRTINLWLDKDRFSRLPDPKEDFLKKVDEWGDFCLFVGVLRWYKGLDYLLDAAKAIKGKILIVGKGPLAEKLKLKILREKIDNVFLLGYQPDENVKFLIKKSRFIVLPSISPAEAFGQILIEASYFGKPMVTTELGTGTSYVNLDNHTGFVIEPKNVIQLADKCNQLFSDNKLVEHFGKNAYERFLKNFTEEIQGPRYIEIYDEITR
jgi:rhamnosyl/mannosyltransferase